MSSSCSSSLDIQILSMSRLGSSGSSSTSMTGSAVLVGATATAAPSLFGSATTTCFLTFAVGAASVFGFAASRALAASLPSINSSLPAPRAPFARVFGLSPDAAPKTPPPSPTPLSLASVCAAPPLPLAARPPRVLAAAAPPVLVASFTRLASRSASSLANFSRSALVLRWTPARGLNAARGAGEPESE